MKFFIICPGYNCESFVKTCYESLIGQTYINWYALMVSDGSTDGTGKELNKISYERIKTVHYPQNKGAAFRRWQGIMEQPLDGEDVVVQLDMDDMFRPNALKRIKREYDNGAWLTYGNWVSLGGYVNRLQMPTPEVLKNRSYRRSRWIYTAPRTCKRFLFDRVQAKDLQDEQGNWLTKCTDLALMYPVLEQCPPERIHGIKDVIYVYRNKHSNTSLRRYGTEHKTVAREWLKKGKIKSLYEEWN